ncbi:hypothetical protein F2Q68_00011709 [Brassica cretica]|uniref:Uncharacterized protein n=1 Tax=Brassica cretica TaxID=69181 RepID=A0A8S9KWJ4_BRACR|nr:hypothetical protein F2Q68_00011709 [Brassica cretica]
MVVDLENAGPKSQLRCPINDYNEGNLGSRSASSVCSSRGGNTTFVLRLHLQYSALSTPSCNIFIWKERNAILHNHTSRRPVL